MESSDKMLIDFESSDKMLIDLKEHAANLRPFGTTFETPCAMECSAPMETFTEEAFLQYGEDEFCKSHQGYFSCGGFAARALRFHLGRLLSVNEKSCDNV
jgi:hypothetical protein